MHIYRLEPTAAPGDPNWDLATSHGTVIVRAESPADARIVASEAEADFLDSNALPADDKSTRFASAFRNDKLYSVSEVADSTHSPEGPRKVLEGEISPNVLLK
jgi:hypothetical protein